MVSQSGSEQALGITMITMIAIKMNTTPATFTLGQYLVVVIIFYSAIALVWDLQLIKAEIKFDISEFNPISFGTHSTNNSLRTV